MFFSEEKNQKTFISPPFATLRPWPASIRGRPGQKSFGSFLPKRTFFLRKALKDASWPGEDESKVYALAQFDAALKRVGVHR